MNKNQKIALQKYRMWVGQSKCSYVHATDVPTRGLPDIIQPYDDMTNFIGHLIESLSASRSYRQCEIKALSSNCMLGIPDLRFSYT